MKKKPTQKRKKTTPPQPEVKESILAPYRFTPDEVSAMERELRGKLSEIEILEDGKKTSAQDFKLRIENRENDVKQLRWKLDSGEEQRPLDAVVKFAAKQGKKTYHHPETDELIREENMTPADWQLPMFVKKGEVETVDPLALQKPGGKAKAPAATSPPADPAPGGVPDDKNEGKTNVGAALDVATLKTTVAPITLNLEGEYTSAGLTRAFRMAAKAAKWSEPQIKFLAAEMKKADTVEKMIETLRPFVKEVQP